MNQHQQRSDKGCCGFCGEQKNIHCYLSNLYHYIAFYFKLPPDSDVLTTSAAAQMDYVRYSVAINPQIKNKSLKKTTTVY